MRLFNTHSYRLSLFYGDEIPKYAILSHTWGREEVSFQHIEHFGSDGPTPQVRSMTGFAKIESACEQARRENIDWVWIDTCCIDKTSSAELAEAINSMYEWYANAEVCYAFLVDVPRGDSISDPNSAFRRSRWFTRGWTLQELIAPAKVVFYGAEWSYVGFMGPGMRNEKFAELIEDITDVPMACLLGWKFPESYSVAQRMSWASKRKCTRIEDVAYSLMGIFDVNMPLVYGEGKKAFVRLQEEIIKSIDDHSILAWTVSEDDIRADKIGSVLAESPADFARSGNVVTLGEEGKYLSSMTKKGLQLHLEIGKALGTHKAGDNIIFAALNCRTGNYYSSRVGLWLLQPCRNISGDNTYCRYITASHKVAGSVSLGGSQEIIVRKKITDSELANYFRLGSFHLHSIDTTECLRRSMCDISGKYYKITAVDSVTRQEWDAKNALVRHLTASRISIHAFQMESNAGAELAPIVFLAGIKRHPVDFEPEAVFCLLLHQMQDLDSYINDIAEQKIDAPWSSVRESESYDIKREPLTSSSISIHGYDVFVGLHLELPYSTRPTAGRWQIYHAAFTFGRDPSALNALGGLESEKRIISLHEAERTEILGRMMLNRQLQEQWKDFLGARMMVDFSNSSPLANRRQRRGPESRAAR